MRERAVSDNRGLGGLLEAFPKKVGMSRVTRGVIPACRSFDSLWLKRHNGRAPAARVSRSVAEVNDIAGLGKY